MNNNFRDDYQGYRDFLLHSVANSFGRGVKRVRENERNSRQERERIIERSNQRSRGYSKSFNQGANNVAMKSTELYNKFFGGRLGITANSMRNFMRAQYETNPKAIWNNACDMLVKNLVNSLNSAGYMFSESKVRQMLQDEDYIGLLRASINPNGSSNSANNIMSGFNRRRR